MKPPYRITPELLALCGRIERLCGRLEGWHRPSPFPKLRRLNRIRTVQGSLAIEGNTLSLDQVTAVLEGKRVRGPAREIREVENALQVYEDLPDSDVFSPAAFLRAHGMLMQGLLADAGRWRRGEIGIAKGARVTHLAPPPARVPGLMKDLFRFLKREKGLSFLIRSCVFHYEITFIHPFTDGNGRMARLWQSALLARHDPLFAFVPVESLVKKNQKAYYRALESADRLGESTPFVEFMLKMIEASLAEFIGEADLPRETMESRLRRAQEHFGRALFSRRDYRSFCKTISTATASRDLAGAVAKRLLRKQGDKITARYRFSKGSGR